MLFSDLNPCDQIKISKQSVFNEHHVKLFALHDELQGFYELSVHMCVFNMCVTALS